MVRESILHKLRACKSCGEPTPYSDGYCETCIPPEQEYTDIEVDGDDEPDQ